MPQLDPSSFSSQIFWLTICFVLLYVLLARKFLPAIQSVLSLRADTIGADIEQAKRMKSEAEMARESYEKAMVHARARSQALTAEAQADIAAQAHKRQAELDAELEKKLAASERAIVDATRGVTDKLSGVVADLVSTMVDRIVQHRPDAGAVAATVDALLTAKSEK